MIVSDLRQMSDGQNTNFVNFYWAVPYAFGMTNYYGNVAVRTNQLNYFYVLQHTNQNWVGVGYAVSNYVISNWSIGMGALYRYETNVTGLAPSLTNDLFSVFAWDARMQVFPTNYWHLIADGVVDLEIQSFEQYGNPFTPLYFQTPGQYSYPVFYSIPALQTNFLNTNACVNNTALPSAVELQFGILEPDALIQARVLASSGTQAALAGYLSSNGLLQTEIFRQRITIGPTIQ